jgi:elongation factor Ts
MVEVNCETDFVAKSESFRSIAQQVLDAAVTSGSTDPDSLAAVETEPGTTVAALLDGANATLGEKIVLRRVARVEGEHVAAYQHRTSPDLPPQIGVLLAVSGASDDDTRQVARDVALHIAALSPIALTADDIDEATLANERRIAEETARNEGKPEQAIPKIVEGRLKGFLKDNVLLDQPFSKDNKKTVGTVLAEAGLSATGFARFRVGA